MLLIAAPFADSPLPAPLWWLLAIWMFALGASIGSFMNVVVYRLPAGLSLVHPGSHCPRCRTPLAARDNIPIFGWLWLRGRCRYCSLPISPRYPLVELLVAGMFLLLAVAEPLSGGANLPPGAVRSSAENAADWTLWGMYAYQLFLLCALVCAALAEYDGHALMPRLAVPLLLVGWAAPLFCPELHPQPSGLLSPQTLATQPWAAGLVDSLAGAAAGLLLALAAWPLGRRPKVNSTAAAFSQTNRALAMTAAGLFLGWQPAAALAVATAAAQLALACAARWRPTAGKIGWIGCLTPAAFAWVVGWGPIESRLTIFAQSANLGTFAAACACVLLFAGLTYALRR